MKTTLLFLALCICAVYAGAPLGLHAPFGVGYAAPYAAHYAAAPAVVAAPVAVPVAVPAPVYIDNAHYKYGYLNPYGNGHVSVARTGPIESHSYTFRAGTYFRK